VAAWDRRFEQCRISQGARQHLRAGLLPDFFDETSESIAPVICGPDGRHADAGARKEGIKVLVHYGERNHE
jgi:hypothetical protein